MRKILLTTALCFTSYVANAEVFVGGLAGMAYSDETFSMTFEPYLGYEFNEKFAIGTGGGFSLYDGDAYGLLNPYLRFTPCQNDRVAFDLKLQSNMQFGDGDTYAIIGVSPGIRAKLSDHWQLSSDFGIFGVECYGGCSPAFALKNVNVNVAILYRFDRKSKDSENK